jgi:hypothetical protein
MPLSDAQKAAVAAYRSQKADRARNARLTKASPVGPRPDEWEGHDRPREQRGGAPNPEATGPKSESKPVTCGYWLRGQDNAEHWIPDPSWQPPTTDAPDKEASVPEVKIVSIPNKGSHVAVGAGGRLRNLEATGPIGIPWVDPSIQER